MEFSIQTSGVSILFVDEQLSPLAAPFGDVPAVGDEVQWGQDIYEVLAVRRFYDTGDVEREFAARVIVRPLEQE